MRLFLFIFLFFGIIYAQDTLDDQLATIDDKDGYTNVRIGPGTYAEVIWQFRNSDIFYYSPSRTNGEWCFVYCDFDTSSIPKEKRKNLLSLFKPFCNHFQLEGYIHKSRIVPLVKLGKVNFDENIITDTSILLTNDSISFSLTSSRYHKSKHKFRVTCNVAFIDGFRVWGTDQGYPTKEISSFTFSINGKSFSISQTEYLNLYEPEFGRFHFYYGRNGGIFLHMHNSDGAGVYDAVFLIKDGEIHRIFVSLNPYV
jgi:hypothetical protein